jgi:hypothetical protein
VIEPHPRRQPRPDRRARHPASTRARAAIGILLAGLALGACGGGNAATAGASAVTPSAAGSAAAGSAAAGSAAAGSGAPASPPVGPTTSPAASASPAGGTGAIPSDVCSVVTKADVQAAFGGNPSAPTVDENGHCSFDVSGTIHAGPNAGVPGTVGVSFGDQFSPYDTAKVVFGDSITKVDGLGTEAWYGLTAVHAKIAGGELVVSGFWVGHFDLDILQKDTVTLTKTILAHL